MLYDFETTRRPRKQVASEPPAGNSFSGLEHKKSEVCDYYTYILVMTESFISLFLVQGKRIIKTIAMRFPDTQHRMSIESGDYFFHYSIADGICVLTLSERRFSRQKAYVFNNFCFSCFCLCNSRKSLENRYSNLQSILECTIARTQVRLFE